MTYNPQLGMDHQVTPWPIMTEVMLPLMVMGMMFGMIRSTTKSDTKVEPKADKMAAIGATSPTYQALREKLVSQYGSWTVGFAESMCPEGDMICVSRKAKSIYANSVV